MVKDWEKRQGEKVRERDDRFDNKRRDRIEDEEVGPRTDRGGKEEEYWDSKSKITVLKRSLIDGDFVFKVKDKRQRKEIFMSREEILENDPLALCLFYEKHIVPQN